MPSHQFQHPKVVPVVAGPSPHREDGDDGKLAPPVKDDESDRKA